MAASHDAPPATPSQHATSRWLVRLALLVQTVFVLVGALDLWRASRALERAYRGGVESTAASFATQWLTTLSAFSEGLAPGHSGTPPGDRTRGAPHLVPVADAEDVRLVAAWREAPADEWRRRALAALRPPQTEWSEFPDNEYARGLRFARALPNAACRSCHAEAGDAEPGGWLTFVVPTQYTTRVLATRKRDMLTERAALGAGVSLAFWLFVAFAVRRARQGERALEAAYRAAVGLPEADAAAAAASSLASLLHVPVVLVTRVAGAELELLASFGPLPDTRRVPIAATPCESVVRDRRPVVITSGLAQRFPASVQWAGVALAAYHGVPLLDDRGEALGVLAVADVVPRRLGEQGEKILEIHAMRLARELERRQREERDRELEQRLLQTQKLEALGTLAGGIAHDFNNVLAGISNTAEVLERSLPHGPDRERAGKLVQLAQRGGEVVRRILAFSRNEVPTARAVSLNAVVNDALALARHSLGPEIELVSEVDPSLPTVDGDAAELQQAVLNVLINARDAMPRGGRVVVRTRSLASGTHVELEVEDQGCGIAAEALPHVFEPFFTTKAPGRGSGLGLSMVYRTVTLHGGAVAIDSQPEQGTRVTLTFPRGSLPKEPEGGARAIPGGRKLTVLVVDDEPLVLESLSEMLALEGHTVVSAASAADALRAWESKRQAVDVAILDVAMPGGSGLELARRLRHDRPGFPIVFSSGHATEALGGELLGQPGVAFLQKPYGSQALLEAVRRVVGEASAAS